MTTDLLNHLWQSTAFAAAAAALALLLRDKRAAVRFWVWMAASLKFLIGQVMRETKGRANPQTAQAIVTRELGNV